MAGTRATKPAASAVHKGPHPANRDAIRRIASVEGQIRGIRRMVEEEAYCVDIVTQIAAARAALKQAGLAILKRHIETCISDAVRKGGSERTRVISELMQVLTRDGS